MLATLKIGLACSNFVRAAFASGIALSKNWHSIKVHLDTMTSAEEHG
jgi:hypothetical protein